MTSDPKSDTMLYSNMKSIITLVDKLRDFKLDNYISLPRITVLGEQSAGKSSILESICGLNFLPRGSGVVTRRPLELRLRHTNIPTPYFVFTKDYPTKKFSKEEEVCKLIEELTDKVAGLDKFISAEPIVLELYSPHVPDLTLVDLPGITRIPVGKQPQNIEAITKNLIRLYCESPDSLILCVIPANIDMSTSDALQFAKQLDPLGSRTLGVLSKIDLMDEGVDCKKVLLNQEIKLTHGFVGIKGRNQREINEKKSVKDSIQTELNFFCRHPIYSTLPSDILGTSSLVAKTSKILYEMIKTALPRIQKEIGEKKKRAKETLEALGDSFPDSDEKKMELVFKLVRAFKESFDQEITGKYFFEDSQSLRSKVQKKKSETITFQVNQIFNDIYHEMTEKNYQVTAEYSDSYIQNAIETYQGDSMPGFQSFDSFLFLITPKLTMLKSPVYEVLEEAKNILETRGNELLDEILKKYPLLLGEIRDTFMKVINKTKMNTQKILDNIIRCEENYLFSNNPEILGSALIKKPITRNMTAREVLANELRFRIDSYYNITVKNMRNTVPKIIGQFLLKKLRDNLEVEILNSLAKKNYCIDGFEESETTSGLRGKTKHELGALTSAENLLINEFGMTFVLAQNINNSQALERSSHGKIEDDQDLVEDIDRMNDDFLNFNLGLIKLGGKQVNFAPIKISERAPVQKVEPVQNQRPIPRQNEPTSQKIEPVYQQPGLQNQTISQNSNTGIQNPQTFKLGAQGANLDKKLTPTPTNPQESINFNKPNVQEQVNFNKPTVLTPQNSNPGTNISSNQQPQQNIGQQSQQRPMTGNQIQPGQQQTSNFPNQQTQNTVIQQKPVQSNQFDINLVSTPSNNQQKPLNTSAQNAFANFGTDRNKSPIKSPGQQIPTFGNNQPSNTQQSNGNQMPVINQQVNSQQTNNQQKPGLNLQKPEDLKQTKPISKVTNLFG